MSLQFDKQGHRGCRGLLPENTIPAFKKAITLGVTTLELDVVITKDQQVLVSHEAFFNVDITTFPDEYPEKKYNLFEMDYAEIKLFDVGLKKHPKFPQQENVSAYKPTLNEVITVCEATVEALGLPAIQYNIEVKCAPETDSVFHPLPAVIVDLLMKEVIDNNIEERVSIQSFDKRVLQHLHANYPAICTGCLYEGDEVKTLAEHTKELGFTPNKYSPIYSLVTTDLIEECKNNGVLIVPWTVNTFEEMKRLKSMGVDGIISDYPNLLQQL